MDVDRETVHQLLLAGGAVALFIAGALFVSSNYRTNGNLSAEGGMMLVGTLGFFIVLMLGAGLWLERNEY